MAATWAAAKFICPLNYLVPFSLSLSLTLWLVFVLSHILTSKIRLGIRSAIFISSSDLRINCVYTQEEKEEDEGKFFAPTWLAGTSCYTGLHLQKKNSSLSLCSQIPSKLYYFLKFPSLLEVNLGSRKVPATWTVEGSNG